MRHVAYLTSEYPGISHTFVQREILALRKAGVAVSTFSIRRPAEAVPRSETDAAELANTVYVLPPRPLPLLGAHLLVALCRPLRYVRALFFAARVRPPGLRALLWQLFYFVEAVYLWRAIRRRGIGHVHVHFAMACAAVAMIATRLGDLTFSVTTHGPTVFYDKVRYQLREKVRWASLVVCISDFCRSQVLALARPEDWNKLKIVHCGVDPAGYAPAPERPGGRDEPVRLLNVSRLSPVKAHAVLLEAIAELHTRGCNVHCTIVGDGPERARLESLGAQLEIQAQIRFTGYVDQDEIQRFYDEADVFVLPSFAEGLPVVLMEAMAKEMPVVASRIMGIPELVEENVDGLLVAPGRVSELADAVARLAGEPDLRAIMGARGRRKICQAFDMWQLGAQLAEIFAEISPAAPPLEGGVSERIAAGARGQ